MIQWNINIKLTNMFSIPYLKQNNNNNKNHRAQQAPPHQHKNIYQMHYVPKLTEQILADSDITENAAVSQDSRCRDSRYEYILNKWGTAIRDNRNQQPKEEQKIQISEGTEDLGNLAMKIRYGIEYFITSIGSEEMLSHKLEFAIQNLLLHMLNVANTLSRMAPIFPNILQTSVKPKSSEIHTIQKNYKDIQKDYYRDQYEQETGQRGAVPNYTRPSLNNMRIQDDEEEFVSQGELMENVIAEQNSSREESMSEEVDVQAFTNSHHPSRNSSSSSQYYQNTTNQAIIKFLNIKNPQSNTKSSNKFTNYHPYNKQSHQPNQVEYDEVYTENQSEIGIEEPSSTSIMIPDNFVKKYDYYSGSCQPLRPTNPHNHAYHQNIPRSQDNVQQSSDIDCSISEYYIEESPCSKPPNKKSNKQNKYSVENSQHPNKEIGEARSKYEKSKYDDRSKITQRKEDDSHDGFTYSEVVSRKKIF